MPKWRIRSITKEGEITLIKAEDVAATTSTALQSLSRIEGIVSNRYRVCRDVLLKYLTHIVKLRRLQTALAKNNNVFDNYDLQNSGRTELADKFSKSVSAVSEAKSWAF